LFQSFTGIDTRSW